MVPAFFLGRRRYRARLSLPAEPVSVVQTAPTSGLAALDAVEAKFHDENARFRLTVPGVPLSANLPVRSRSRLKATDGHDQDSVVSTIGKVPRGGQNHEKRRSVHGIRIDFLGERRQGLDAVLDAFLASELDFISP